MKNNYVPAKNNLQLTTLLHDIGKVVFRRKCRKNYEEIVLQAKAENVPVFIKEKANFGCNHAEVGAWLMEAWQMPADIIQPIAGHHLEHTADEHMVETSILKLANWVDCAARMGASAPNPPGELAKLASILDMDIHILLRFQQDLIRTVSVEDHKQVAAACI
ncbi:MAG: hypothetical protein A2X49_00150 [Lentisphaerae bacterium GWF2_52_8]|nr:MAG: hypothetical protein A2X49_00150 [Lentisphaerae bacterium GWF2_52_8]